jgi:hypothetical protein
MNAPAPALTEPAAAPRARDRAWAERQLAILGRLAEAGLEIAVALEAQAKGGEAVVQGDLAMAYSRVARAVRQTIMLQSKLVEALGERETGRAGRRAAARASAARIVRRAIDSERPNDAERAERLAAEAAERLREQDFSDLLARPFADAVAEICRDLGLSPDWLALAEHCAAAEQALAGRGGEAPEEPDGAGSFDVRWRFGDRAPPDGESPSPGGPVDWRKRRLGRHSPWPDQS